MKWVVIAVRTLVGLLFVFAGSTFFLGMEPPPPPTPEAGAFAAGMGRQYMTVVKVLEVVGGLLLLTGRLAPLGVVLLMPVAVNIALFDLLLVGKPSAGVVSTLALAFVAWGYRRYFAPVFTANARLDPAAPSAARTEAAYAGAAR